MKSALTRCFSSRGQNTKEKVQKCWAPSTSRVLPGGKKAGRNESRETKSGGSDRIPRSTTPPLTKENQAEGGGRRSRVILRR